MSNKPKAPVIGNDGNVFSVLSVSTLALRHAGQRDKADEMKNRVFKAPSYTEALTIMQEYVEFTKEDEE